MGSAELRGEQRTRKSGAGSCLKTVKRVLFLEGICKRFRTAGLGPSTRKSSQVFEARTMPLVRSNAETYSDASTEFPQVLSHSIRGQVLCDTEEVRQ